jgi:two-component system LytT family response regulator
MKVVRCAIIEDEPLGAKTLESLLKKYKPQFEVIYFGQSLTQAREIMLNKDVDLVFADVELLDGNIFDVLKAIEVDNNKQIIFTTAYEEFGARAFNYPAIHYLLKPINPVELEKAILRYRNFVLSGTAQATEEKLSESPGKEFEIEKLSLPTQNGVIFIDYNDVIRVQSSNKYSIVFTIEGRQHIVPKPLSRFEEVLSKKGFVRVHDSHIVNVKHLKGYIKGKGGEIIMSDGAHVPVSVRRKDILGTIFKHPLL